MARTAIAVQTILDNSHAAVTFVAADAANGMVFPNDGKTELIVKTAGATSATATVRSVACSHGRTADLVISLAATEVRSVPKLDAALFNQTAADLGSVYVDFTNITNVTVAAVKRG